MLRSELTDKQRGCLAGLAARERDALLDTRGVTRTGKHSFIVQLRRLRALLPAAPAPAPAWPPARP